MTQIVFLLWQNDAVLSVHATRESAEAAAEAVRDRWTEQHWDWGHWVQLPSGRWYTRDGPIARLEIDAREVRK